VGVNIHVGTADHGHYYSIINTNRETKQKEENKGEIWGKVEGDDWKVFDDSNVKFFSFKLDLKKEAFGGD
jgi:ubiquitin C-terminal hydrolase